MNHAQAVDAVAEAVQIDAAGALLDAELALPRDASGVVVFAHGGGSGRRNPRNGYVAELLQEAGLGTLMVDLLTPAEALADARGSRNRFDVALLGSRLGAAAAWLARSEAARLPVGCFGSGTGSAAALLATAEEPGLFQAVVCRGGRPDLASGRFEDVKTPTLLLAGGDDLRALESIRTAARRLPDADLVVLDGAGHLFDEPGALELVSARAAEWFLTSLGP